MNIAGRVGVLIGICLPIMAASSRTNTDEEKCDFQGLVTVKRFTTSKQFERLPKDAMLKVQVIEAALSDVNAWVITDGKIDVSDRYFPLKFNLSLDCEKLKRTIMPSINISLELDDKLLFINETMHPFSQGEALQKIELKKIFEKH